ncbi:MAG: hypothetical protein EBQ51_02575 [Verrucomicrobia bacterium]|nr:hypothetical protein [Verrucomicrobiota bacterium]
MSRLDYRGFPCSSEYPQIAIGTAGIVDRFSCAFPLHMNPSAIGMRQAATGLSEGTWSQAVFKSVGSKIQARSETE